MIELNKIVAKVRLHHHANMIDINGALNQLHLMSDERCEESNRRHFMTILTDICPRLGKDISFMNEES